MSQTDPQRLLIGGAWRETGRVYERHNPSELDRVVVRQCLADASLVSEAIAAAQAAQPEWAAAGPWRRAQVLDAAGAEVLARSAELGALLASEEGKTRAEAVAEVQRAGHILRFQAHAALLPEGEVVASTRPGLRVQTSREPVGVVGVITPWNFPIAIPAWKIAPALAWGNAVVFKPAEIVPGSAWALSEILHRHGLPPGVLNFVPGSGAEVGQALLEDERVKAVSFTGSVATGRRVAAACAARNARFQLEMGGKNPLVVLDDADLETALECAIQSAFFSTGQRCTASSRVIATPGIYTRLREALIERTRALRVGHALDATTQIGPVADEAQLQTNLRYIAVGREEGATLAAGGDLVRARTRGHYLAPALFVDADNGMRICREEIFGPVAALIPADGPEHALALANDTPFGLSAGVCTTSLRWAERFERGLQAGMVMVNAPTAGVDHHVPFGGAKGSSFGPREQGLAARDFYTHVKTTYRSS